MKQYFIAYRFSGEDEIELEQRLATVVDALKKAGINGYANLSEQATYKKNDISPRQIMKAAFARIDASDGLFVLIASTDKSEGQLMEVGYALAKEKPIIAAINTKAVSYVDQLADRLIPWRDLDHLSQQLSGLVL